MMDTSLRLIATVLVGFIASWIAIAILSSFDLLRAGMPLIIILATTVTCSAYMAFYIKNKNKDKNLKK
ncbi:hypothetical protein GCM10022402_47520 [Salinactinospora qingdaonensis]|uniref:Uncharacterized protein n=1 Tax=Salinactinospora qingdaonensis TaxID=702744 RepID=A0ABP7GHW2_9ACTN